jgi:ubiquitin carboxyl-terminal hydrolase 2/21
MASILQCIFATAPLTKYFLTEFNSETKLRSRPLSSAYKDLLESGRSSSSCVTPTDLKNQVSKVARQFTGYGQQDAQEFLRFLLDGMHNELNRISTKPKYKEINCEKESVDQQSETWQQYFHARDDSIITDLFEGQLCSSITCTKCNHKSYTFDNFMDLSVSIPRKAVRMTGYIDVTECLSNYIQPEVMESCGYKCSKCKTVDNMEKQMTIFRFPKILVIHLKRFYNSTMRREKLSTTVNIPDSLDVRPYATPSSSKLFLYSLIFYRSLVQGSGR